MFFLTGSGVYVVDGKGGDDTISVNGNFTVADQLSGDGGSDALFFNGAPQLKMDAVFVHLKLQTSEQ